MEINSRFPRQEGLDIFEFINSGMSLHESLARKLIDKLGQGTAVNVVIEGADCGGKAQVSVTSTAFDGMSRINRHRLVHDCLSQEIKDSLHAITISAKTPQELGTK